MLAKRAGIELESEDPRDRARAQRKRGDLPRQRRRGAVLPPDARATTPAGEAAARVLRAARDRPETIATFTLGFAPDRWDGLVDELQREGVDPALAAQAGLVKPGQRGYYDFYRGRLMIPTRAMTGEVIAFGGRLVGHERAEVPQHDDDAGLHEGTLSLRARASRGAPRSAKGTS